MDLPSVREAPLPNRGALTDQAGPALVALGERSLVILALVRLLVGYLWFQQLAWKMPPSFGGLRADVVRELHHTIFPGYNVIIQQVFLAHFSLLGWSVWTAELLVGLSLLFGLFTRLGALLALVLSLQLFVGIAYAPGEWYWAYVMLLLLSLCLLVVPAGRRLGCDQLLQPWFARRAPTSRLSRWLAWTV